LLQANGVGLSAAGRRSGRFFEDDRDLAPDQAAQSGRKLGARGGEGGGLGARRRGDHDLPECLRVGLAQRCVGDEVIAEPEPVAIFGTSERGAEGDEDQGQATEQRADRHGLAGVLGEVFGAWI